MGPFPILVVLGKNIVFSRQLLLLLPVSLSSLLSLLLPLSLTLTLNLTLALPPDLVLLLHMPLAVGGWARGSLAPHVGPQYGLDVVSDHPLSALLRAPVEDFATAVEVGGEPASGGRESVGMGVRAANQYRSQ